MGGGGRQVDPCSSERWKRKRDHGRVVALASGGSPMRSLFATAIISVASLEVLACGGSGPSGATPRLSLLSWFANGNEKDAFDRLLDQFRMEVPGVVIDSPCQPRPEMQCTADSLLAEGQSPPDST